MKITRKLSTLDGFIKGFEQGEWWVGVDVHKRSYSVALRRSDGQVRTWTSPPDPAGLIATLNRLGIRPKAVAQESGPTGYDLARRVETAGMGVIVGAPSRIPRPVTAGAKCDRLDCHRLAEYAARGMITGIAIPSVDEEAFRGLVRRRQAITDQIRRCKQRIKALILFHGISDAPDFTTWSAVRISALRRLVLPCDVRVVLDSLLEELTAHETAQKRLDTHLAVCLKSDPLLRRRYAALKSVPGVGDRIAQTFLAEIFRPERFATGDEIASYLGLAPMVHHSGEKTPKGRLRQVGQQRLRSLLIEASWIWKTHDPGAQTIYGRVLAASGIAQKAIVALARRLAVILWRLAVEQRPYYPLLPLQEKRAIS